MSTGLGSGGSGSEGHRGGGVMAGAHVNEGSKARKARVAGGRTDVARAARLSVLGLP